MMKINLMIKINQIIKKTNKVLMEGPNLDQMMNHLLILTTGDNIGPKGGAQKSIPPHRWMVPPFLQMRRRHHHDDSSTDFSVDDLSEKPPPPPQDDEPP